MSEEAGYTKCSHTCHWRVPQWSQLRVGTEYSSPPLLFDGLKWSIKLFKGKIKTPDTLSVYVQIHETAPGSLRGIRKNVQLSIKINNTNTSYYYQDFCVDKRLQPVWYSEKHTRWGEDSLGNVINITRYLGRDQLSLSVNINILKSEVDEMNTAVSADAISSSIFSRLIDSPQYSDVSIKVIEEEVEKWESISGAGDDKSETITVDDKTKQTVRTFYGHKNFLAANSPWFDIIFTNGMKESLENEITISGVKRDIFYRLLKYCYTFKIDIDGVRDAYEVLKAADRFQISNIRQECLRYLRQEINEENVWDIWECADINACERTINACALYASVEIKDLIKHPSWLYANPRVIKMALDIEEGDFPEETALYEAVLLWAKEREDKIIIFGDNARKVKNPSMTRTQLLASVVDVEPLAISSAVIEPDEDDDLFGFGFGTVVEEEEEEEEEEDKEEEERTLATGVQEVIKPIAPHDVQLDMADILQSIRFPMMPPDYLANFVETDCYIMSIDGMKDMLYEAYKFHAVGGTSSSVRCQPRRPKAEKDEL